MSMRGTLRSVLLMILFCGAITAAQESDDPSICNAALAKDLSTTISTSEQDLEFLRLVDYRTFNEAHDKGSFGATLPISDVILKASTDWENFRQNRTSYLEKIGYKAHSKTSDFQHFEITAPIAYTEWGKCIQALASRSKEGLFIWKVKDDQNSVIAKIYYKVPESTQRKYKTVPIVGKLRYGNSEQQIDLFGKKTIESEREIPLSIARRVVNGEPAAIEATIEAGKFSGIVVSDWKPKPLEPTSTTAAEPRTYACNKGGISGYRFWKTEYTKTLRITECTVPEGVITDVVAGGCSGGPSCGHFWPVFGDHNWYSPDRKTVTVVYATDHGGPEDPTLLVTVYYSVQVRKCIGTDGQLNGAGCYKKPGEVLALQK